MTIKIICAAVKLGDIVFPCYRHWDDKCRVIIKKILPIEDVKEMISSGKEIQGFIGTDGKFYTREEAAKIYNQYSEKKVEKLLFSEDLY